MEERKQWLSEPEQAKKADELIGQKTFFFWRTPDLPFLPFFVPDKRERKRKKEKETCGNELGKSSSGEFA